jgi:hypothetical protein
MDEKWPIIEGTHGMRSQMLNSLSDADLAYNPGGENVTLGEVWRELGEIEKAYIDSVKTFKQDFNYRNPEAGLEKSVTKLKAWFEALDNEFKTALAALSDDDAKKTIARASGFQPAVELQLDIYLQALLIFFGKASVYYRAMGKPLPENFKEWFG